MLTATPCPAMMILPLTHSAVGIDSPDTTGQKAALHAVFYCPPKRPGSLCLAFVMVDCAGEASASPVPVAGTVNPVQSATQELTVLRGGYPTLQETAIMQNPKKLTPSVSAQSRFNVVTRSGQSLARRVQFTQAIQIKAKHPASLIKYAGREVAA